jgi:hypothetical protein
MKHVTPEPEDINIKATPYVKSSSLTSLGSSNYQSDVHSENALSVPSEEKEYVNNEITDMHLIWEDFGSQEIIMMICSNAREYIIYDESDTESSKVLRTVTGGH